MVVRWVDDGAPLGNRNDLPSPVEWPAGDRFLLEDEIGAPDLIVTGPEWTMVAEGQDQWMDQRVDVNLPETRWVRTIETKPSAGEPDGMSNDFRRESIAVVARCFIDHGPLCHPGTELDNADPSRGFWGRLQKT